MQVALVQQRFRTATYTALCNPVGEEECLTFSGESFVCSANGEVAGWIGAGITC